MWAAYRRGIFEDLFEGGLDIHQFDVAFIELTRRALLSGMELWVFFGNTTHGNIPIALLAMTYDGHIAKPHINWFPEATPRNKLEAIVKFFIEVKKTHLALFDVREEQAEFFRHVSRYGLLRAIGKVRDYYSDGTHAIMFQTVGKK